MGTVMLATRGLAKKYDRAEAVKGVSFDCREGQALAVLGPSGCGKTTLLRLIAGLERPDAGEVSIAGEIVSRPGRLLPPHKRQVGLIFQDLALWPHMTVYENLEFGLTTKVPNRENRKARIDAIVERLDLADLDRCYPGGLSGGEQQRVALARSLVSEPRLLLMDEPLSNLDTILKQQMLALVNSLKTDFGLTIVYVTHNLEEALSIADRIAVMNQGRFLQVGRPEDLRSNPADKLVEAFLGVSVTLEDRAESSNA